MKACPQARQSELHYAGFWGLVAALRQGTSRMAHLHRFRSGTDHAKPAICSATDPSAVELNEMVYAFDSNASDICFAVFPWV